MRLDTRVVVRRGRSRVTALAWMRSSALTPGRRLQGTRSERLGPPLAHARSGPRSRRRRPCDRLPPRSGTRRASGDVALACNAAPVRDCWHATVVRGDPPLGQKIVPGPLLLLVQLASERAIKRGAGEGSLRQGSSSLRAALLLVVQVGSHADGGGCSPLGAKEEPARDLPGADVAPHTSFGLQSAALVRALERGCVGSGCSTRTLWGPASRDAALRRSSARRLAGANALQANQRPNPR